MKIHQLNWTVRFAVALVFCLIFVGGLVTSWQAGMAVPDWPLSFGSLNPDGWWANFPVRLEHGHRLLAACVGLVIGVLCAAVWQNWRALWIAFFVSIAASVVGSVAGVSAPMRAHLGIWPAAIAFLAVLALSRKREELVGDVERRLAVCAFVLVCLQATLGGFRVTQETAGLVSLATVLRVVHGCVAQAFLVVLVSLAVRLSILLSNDGPSQAAQPSGLAFWVGVAGCAVYGQLVLGATMRHLGAGLAIPTFPAADPSGAWMPKTHNLFTDLNFTHTRFGAVVVLVLVVFAVQKVVRRAARPSRAVFWASVAAVCVVLQAVLGVLVVLHQRPKTLATLHVVLGAVLLSCLAAALVHLLSQSESRGTPQTP